MSKAEQTADGRNKRSVWEIATQPYPEAHFATFPEDLVKPCILAGCPEGGTVLDPFVGSGTSCLVANTLGRRAIGIELNPIYLALAQQRCAQTVLSQFLDPLPDSPAEAVTSQ
jgi:DNA modification methylase